MATGSKRKHRDVNDDDAVTAVNDPQAAKPEQPEPTDELPGSSDTLFAAGGSGRWRRYSRWILVALVVALLAAPVRSWLQYQSQNVSSKNAIVRGHLAEIGSRIDGLVTDVDVDAADRVTAGQVLVRLDDRRLRAETDEAAADVAALEREIEVERLAIQHARRALSQRQKDAAADLNVLEAQAKAVEIRADDAREREETRASLMSRGGAVSAESMRTAKTNRRTAEAELQAERSKLVAALAVEDNLSLDGEGLRIRARKVGVLEANLEKARARLEGARADLASAQIVAPQDGAIVRRIVQPGSSVEVGQPMITMWLGEELWIEAWIDEDDVGVVKRGSKAIVTLQSVPGREFTGTVDKIGLVTDFEMPESEIPQPRFARMRGAPVLGVRITLDNPPAELLPGLSAVVAIRKVTE